MGFEGAISWRGYLQWQIQHQFNILTNNVRCPQPIWSTCTTTIASGCSHSNDILLTCSLRAASVFQLVDSSGNTITTEKQEGLLLHNGGTVSNTHFNITAAQAICKIMGFEDALQWTQGQKWKIQQTYSILTENIRCPLADWPSCNYTDSYTSNHKDDVFLKCSGSRSPFSLVDKRGYTVSGSQEFLLLYNGGTVCSDEFSNQSANAACRDMGYSGFRSWRVGTSWGNYRIALDDFNCTKGHFSTCKYTTSHDCVHGNEIFISCNIGSSANIREENIGISGSTRKSEAVSEAGENLAVGILMIICSVLFTLIIKKNVQIDELLKKTAKPERKERSSQTELMN